jgi:hypothetical protein
MGGGAVLVAGLAAGAGLVACGCGGADESQRDAVTDVVAGREEHDEGPDIEYEATLDGRGRLATVQWRAAEFGGQPAGRWFTARYRYPSAAQFASLAGPAPGPRCR